jgi:hypothetical protein
MSTDDQRRASALTGEALLAAQDPALRPLLDRLAEVAGGRVDIRTQAAGILAGTWYAHPGRYIGHELIAAGLLLLSGVVDRDQLGKPCGSAMSAALKRCGGTTQPTQPAEQPPENVSPGGQPPLVD